MNVLLPLEGNRICQNECIMEGPQYDSESLWTCEGLALCLDNTYGCGSCITSLLGLYCTNIYLVGDIHVLNRPKHDP